MLHSAFLAIVLAVSIVAQECTVGSLLDLLVTYQVSVHNASTRTGFATVSTASSSRTATFSPGATIVARSFKAGAWAASVVDLDPELNATLVKLRANTTKLLNPTGLTKAEVQAIYAENANLRAVLKQREQAVGAAKEAFCGGTMQATDPPTDQELVITATFASGKWSFAGC